MAKGTRGQAKSGTPVVDRGNRTPVNRKRSRDQLAGAGPEVRSTHIPRTTKGNGQSMPVKSVQTKVPRGYVRNGSGSQSTRKTSAGRIKRI